MKVVNSGSFSEALMASQVHEWTALGATRHWDARGAEAEATLTMRGAMGPTGPDWARLGRLREDYVVSIFLFYRSKRGSETGQRNRCLSNTHSEISPELRLHIPYRSPHPTPYTTTRQHLHFTAKLLLSAMVGIKLRNVGFKTHAPSTVPFCFQT